MVLALVLVVLALVLLILAALALMICFQNSISFSLIHFESYGTGTNNTCTSTDDTDMDIDYTSIIIGGTDSRGTDTYGTCTMYSLISFSLMDSEVILSIWVRLIGQWLRNIDCRDASASNIIQFSAYIVWKFGMEILALRICCGFSPVRTGIIRLHTFEIFTLVDSHKVQWLLSTLWQVCCEISEQWTLVKLWA